jgi:hypothetical protein
MEEFHPEKLKSSINKLRQRYHRYVTTREKINLFFFPKSSDKGISSQIPHPFVFVKKYCIHPQESDRDMDEPEIWINL